MPGRPAVAGRPAASRRTRRTARQRRAAARSTGTPMFDRELPRRARRVEPGRRRRRLPVAARRYARRRRDATELPLRPRRPRPPAVGPIGDRHRRGRAAGRGSRPRTKVAARSSVNSGRRVIGEPALHPQVTGRPAGRWSQPTEQGALPVAAGGNPIPGATARATVRLAGRRRSIRVQVTGPGAGHAHRSGHSPRTGPVQHRVDVRRTVSLQRRAPAARSSRAWGSSAGSPSRPTPTRAAGGQRGPVRAGGGGGVVHARGSAAAAPCRASPRCAAACGAAGSAAT